MYVVHTFVLVPLFSTVYGHFKSLWSSKSNKLPLHVRLTLCFRTTVATTISTTTTVTRHTRCPMSLWYMHVHRAFRNIHPRRSGRILSDVHSTTLATILGAHLDVINTCIGPNQVNHRATLQHAVAAINFDATFQGTIVVATDIDTRTFQGHRSIMVIVVPATAYDALHTNFQQQ